MVRKMDTLGEPYSDPLDYGNDGYINEEFGDTHEYGGGRSNEIALDHVKRGESILTIPRPVILKPRMTNEKLDEICEKVRSAAALERTLNPLFRKLREIE